MVNLNQSKVTFTFLFLHTDDEELKKEIIDKLKLEEEKSFDKNLQIMRVELQFTSNMRMAISLNGYENDTRYIIGFPK